MDAELIYLAGFFDGEGSIMIKHNGPSAARKNGVGSVVVSVGQTWDWPLLRYQARFGGKIYRSTRGRGHWYWRVTAKAAFQMLEQLTPFLLLKRPQAEAALAFSRTIKRPGGRQRVADATVQERVKLISKVKELNRRGSGVPLVETGSAPYIVAGGN